MPRNLSRLKFRAPKPPPPLNLARLPPGDRLPQALKSHVLAVSKPAANLAVRTVMVQKWKQQPGKTRKQQFRPHTLKDMVDPAGKAKHGQIIYIFRNTRTNQVIYSLAELLDKYHIDQLPFFGKHSKPPALRPDEWAPHCVVTFPSAAQGLNAFRKLREFRKLHELSWDKTNPEWIQLPVKLRIEKIMDQVANTSADLAEVLTIQESQGELMHKSKEEQEQRTAKYLDTKWPEIMALAEASQAPEKRDGDNTVWLAHQIKALKFQLGLKSNQNEADQKRLKAARRSHQVRLRKIEYAQRKARQMADMQAKLEVEAEHANQDGAEEKLKRLRDQIRLLREELANPASTRTVEQVAFDKSILRDYQAELAQFEKAFAAKKQLDTQDHYIYRSVLPIQFKKKLPQPFTLENVEIRWADLLDAEYAAGNWPASISHDTLPLKTAQHVHFMSAAEYEAAVDDEVARMLKGIEKQARVEAGLEEPVLQEPEKTGIWKYIPTVKNPFKRATA